MDDQNFKHPDERAREILRQLDEEANRLLARSEVREQEEARRRAAAAQLLDQAIDLLSEYGLTVQKPASSPYTAVEGTWYWHIESPISDSELLLSLDSKGQIIYATLKDEVINVLGPLTNRIYWDRGLGRWFGPYATRASQFANPSAGSQFLEVGPPGIVVRASALDELITRVVFELRLKVVTRT